MLRLTRKMRYALEAVVDIAYNARPEPVQSREITQRQGIPQRYLEQVMQQLVHSSILKGVRGPRGGYTLARERRRISVGEIIRIIGDAEDADTEKTGTVSALGQTVINPLWDEIQAEMMRRFDSITIEDLCKRAAAAAITPESRKVADFNI